MTAGRSICIALCIALTSLTVVPCTGWAQADEDAARERAKALFMEGLQQYEAGQYEQALAAFQEANRVKPHPLMLFNIAQVLEAMGRLPGALIVYNDFMASNPPDPTEVQSRIARIREILATRWALVEVTTEPSGTSVWLGQLEGPPVGVTPLTIQVPSGAQTIELRLEGFQPVSRPVQLPAGKTMSIGVVMPPLLPVLAVSTEPPGASIRVEGTKLGETPLVQSLVEGKHILTIELDGYVAVEQPIELAASHTVDAPLAVALELEKETHGDLVLDVRPAGATIRVDGAEVGTSPLPAPIRLPQGLHSVEVSAPAAEDHQEMANIVVGQTTRTQITLVPRTSGGIGSEMWAYIIMGVGGAAMVGGGVFGVMAVGADGDLSSCRDDEECAGTSSEVDFSDEVKSHALMTDILVGSGAIIATAGFVFYLLSGDELAAAENESAVTRFGVTVTDGGAAAVGRFRF